MPEMPYFDPVDAINLLRTMQIHVTAVQRQMQVICHELERRALMHDQSKFTDAEFAGFCRINWAARNVAPGSTDYRDLMRRESDTIDRHYGANSHHPEHHFGQMPWLDIVEMVCDWRGAYLAYASAGTWGETVARQILRYQFSAEKHWLIHQVARTLAPFESAK